MRNKILHKLYKNKENYISGEILAADLGVSRTAVWKHINTLKKEGYSIETAPGKGYKLLEMEDKLLPGEIESILSDKTIGKQIIYFDSIDSTNGYAKKEIDQLEDGTVILAEMQTAGRGRRGAVWRPVSSSLPPLMAIRRALAKLTRAPKNCICRPRVIAETQQAIP